MSEEYQILLVDMPTTVKSFVRENPDDSITIAINSRLNQETQLKCYSHELKHISEGDMESGRTADQIEIDRHRKRP